MSTESAAVNRAARAITHHYYCTLPTEGRGKCKFCAAILDPHNIGTMGVLIHRLTTALLDFDASAPGVEWGEIGGVPA